MTTTHESDAAAPVLQRVSIHPPLEMQQRVSLEPQPALTLATVDANAAAVTPADLLRFAMASGDKDIDRLERLMKMDAEYREMQERERQRAAMLSFRANFATFRSHNVIIPKTKRVDREGAGSFMQAEYDKVCGMLSGPLSECGFGFRHDQQFVSRKWVEAGVESDIPWVSVKCFLEHKDGHYETLTLEGPSANLRGNSPVQNMQATASYLKRQSLLAITGTATAGEDCEEDLSEGGASGGSDAKIEAGRAAALQGSDALTAWWSSLSSKERTKYSKEFGAMKRGAALADKHGGRK